MDALRRALGGAVGVASPSGSSGGSGSSKHSLSGKTITVASRKVKVGDVVAEGGMAGPALEMTNGRRRSSARSQYPPNLGRQPMSQRLVCRPRSLGRCPRPTQEGH